jgi:hypothetical protein
MIEEEREESRESLKNRSFWDRSKLTLGNITL